MPGPPRYRTPKAVRNALEEGTVKESDIDSCASHVLQLLQRVGKFDDRKDTPVERAVDLQEHRDLIREAGGEGMVLLKNRNDVLPMKTCSGTSIALLGPLADYSAAHGGGSASLNCHYKITPLQAFSQRLGHQTKISCAKGRWLVAVLDIAKSATGAHIFRVYPDLEEGATSADGKLGWTAEFFKTPNSDVEPFHVEGYPRGSFTTLMNTAVIDAQAVRFGCIYQPPKSGNHYLSFSGLGPSKMFINDELVGRQNGDTKDAMGFLLGVQDEERFRYQFVAGEAYRVRVETVRQLEDKAELFLMDKQMSIHVGIVEQDEMERDLLSEAVALAKTSDYTVVFVGNTTQWETEGQDLETMRLPADGSQDELIAAVAAANPNTIVVNNTGCPVETPWIEDVAAFVQGWYAGQEVGNAILDVLIGEVNPSGKLPVSWPKKYEDTACYGNFGLDSFDSREVKYVEDVYVGYRHFDRVAGSDKEAQYPFGFGLSYTTFEVRGVNVFGHLDSASSDGLIEVTASIRNTGSRAGGETVQVYVAPPVSELVDRPPKSLAGFAKAFVPPRQERSITIKFGKEALAYWDESIHHWRVQSGIHKIIVARSSGVQDVDAVEEIDVHGFVYGP